MLLFLRSGSPVPSSSLLFPLIPSYTLLFPSFQFRRRMVARFCTFCVLLLSFAFIFGAQQAKKRVAKEFEGRYEW